MATTSYLTSRSCQLEPVDLFPSQDMSSCGDCDEVIHRHSPHLLTERMIDIGHCDKVFTSVWLNEDLFLLGTKSNQLLLVDLSNGSIFNLPLLHNGATPLYMDNTGIHSIQVSPNDQHYLASGGLHPNELAIYKLPEMTPYVLGQGHKDWIFDMAWISDNILATGSRDSTMIVWKIPDITTLLIEEKLSLHSLMRPWPTNYPLAETVPSIDMLFRFSNLRVPNSGKVRSLCCNRQSRVLASLQTSLCDSTVHFWDTETFKELSFVNLSHRDENVCLELQPEYNLYVIGSRSHVSLVDWRIGNQTVGSFRSKDRDNGVRSLQFKDDLLSIGSGAGTVTFYDLRSSSYWTHSNEICSLKTTCGWVRNDFNYQEFFSNLPQPPNAVYTHQYSPSYSKLLVAGGPLPLSLYGNYCSLWS